MPLTQFDDKDDVRIKGATDNTLIGNVGDRLKVDAGTSLPVIPAGNVIHKVNPLLNGSNKSMDVNGSGTPQVFEYEATETEYLYQISFLLTDGDSTDETDYGAIGGPLTNGVLLEFEISSTDYEYTNLQDNRDITNTFILGGSTNQKDNRWLNDKGVYFGTARLNPPVCLQSGDKFKATVRDNIAGLDEQTMHVHTFAELP